MSTFDLTKPVKNNLRGDDTGKFRVANNAERDALITGDLVELGHIIYHEADAKHYKLKTYPNFGSVAGVVWEEFAGGGSGTATNIVDNLTSVSSTDSLSANQGRILKGFVDNINTLLSSDDTTLDTLQEIVDFVELNKSNLDNLTIASIAGLQALLNTKLEATDIANKVDKVTGKELSDNNYTNIDKAAVDTIPSISTSLANKLESADIANKVDKVAGKELSTNDFTNIDKAKLDNLENTVIDDTLTSTAIDEALSANQGRILKGFIDNINALLQSNDGTLDELQEIVDFINMNQSTLSNLTISNIAGLQAALDDKLEAADITGKVDVEAGKGLSTNDFTDADKLKLDNLEGGLYESNIADGINTTATVGQIVAGTDIADIKINPDTGLPRTLSEVFDLAFVARVIASISVPKSLTINNFDTTTREVGASYTDPSVSITYNKGSIRNGDNSIAGDLTGNLSGLVVTNPDGIVVVDNSAPTSNSLTFAIPSYPIEFGSNTWEFEAFHAPGTTTYTDNLGGTNTVASIESSKNSSAAVTGNRTVAGRYNRYVYLGARGTSPNTSSAIRALSSAFLNSNNEASFSLAIPANTSEVVIYTISGKNVNVVNPATNEVLTVVTTNTTVNDGGGTAVGYTKNLIDLGLNGFSSAATFNVNITG